MKIRWNHINRGLVLGLVLAAGTAVYVIAQNAAFKKNIPEISDKANEICKEIVEANVGDNREGVQRKLTACLQDDFTYTKNPMVSEDEYYGAENKSSMLFSVENMTLDTTGCDKVTSVEYKQISSSVSKWGIDGANVQVDYQVTYECYGTPMLLCLDGMINTKWNIDRDSDNEMMKTVKVNGSVNMVMFHEDDTWKVSTISYEDYSKISVEYPDGDKGGEANEQE